jgi:hypothetical protein
MPPSERLTFGQLNGHSGLNFPEWTKSSEGCYTARFWHLKRFIRPQSSPGSHPLVLCWAPRGPAKWRIRPSPGGQDESMPLTRARQVPGPTIPSAVTPVARWNPMTAAMVLGPNPPSPASPRPSPPASPQPASSARPGHRGGDPGLIISVTPEPAAMKPGFECARTHSKPGSMSPAGTASGHRRPPAPQGSQRQRAGQHHGPRPAGNEGSRTGKHEPFPLPGHRRGDPAPTSGSPALSVTVPLIRGAVTLDDPRARRRGTDGATDAPTGRRPQNGSPPAGKPKSLEGGKVIRSRRLAIEAGFSACRGGGGLVPRGGCWGSCGWC